MLKLWHRKNAFNRFTAAFKERDAVVEVAEESLKQNTAAKTSRVRLIFTHLSFCSKGALSTQIMRSLASGISGDIVDSLCAKLNVFEFIDLPEKHFRQQKSLSGLLEVSVLLTEVKTRNHELKI